MIQDMIKEYRKKEKELGIKNLEAILDIPNM